MVPKKKARHMDENRRAIRRRVLKGVIIEFDRAAFSCAVRNLSEAGAALDVPYVLAIPHEFTLIMETDQLSRRCRVIWRKENQIGVAFKSGNQPAL
jgi:hypothetical protein